MLIEPPQLRELSAMRAELDCEPPLNLLYLGTILKEHGHQVWVLDCFQMGYDKKETINRKLRIGLVDEEIAKRINDFEPDIVGVSCIYFFNYKMAHLVCKIVKEVDRNIVTVMGGIYATVFYHRVLDDKNVNMVVKNEGELSLLEIANKDIKNGIVENPFIRNLDTLPFPDRGLVNLDDYQRKAYGMTSGRRFTTVSTSRGCPSQCTFCSAHHVWKRTIRFRSAENVLAEIAMLKEKYDIEEIHFIDENINLNNKRFKEIMQGLKKLEIKWSIPSGMALYALDSEIVKLMGESGCYSVALAYESGNQDVLDNIIHKPVRIEKARNLTKEIQKEGIKTRGFFIIGFPGERKEQILDTIQFANDLKLDVVGMNTLKPYPFTDIYYTAKKQGVLIERGVDTLTLDSSLIKTKDFSPIWVKCIIEADRFLALNRKKRKPFCALFKEVFTRNKLLGFYVLALALRYSKRFSKRK